MKRKLLSILACPKCFSEFSLVAASETDDEVVEGTLKCTNCQKEFPITNSIPRFVEVDNYASSFGYQWNLFRKEQLDSHNGTKISAKRFFSETGWTSEELNGKLVVDIGCGAGRFLDVSSGTGAEVIGVDLSSAVDAARQNLADRPNAQLVQASIYELPFRPGTFDFCYCIGVIQHTPDPVKSLESIAKIVRQGGKFAVTIYERRRWFTMLYSKFWLRPITKKMSQATLLKSIQTVMPVLFPVTDILFRIPVLGRLFMFLIPIANYVNEPELSKEQRKAWAILDTFDMLSPQFDQPMVEQETVEVLQKSNIGKITRLPNSGLNLVGEHE